MIYWIKIRGTRGVHGSLLSFRLSAAATATVVAIVTTVVSAAGKHEDKNDNPPAAVTAEKTIIVAHNLRRLLSVSDTNPRFLRLLHRPEFFLVCAVYTTFYFRTRLLVTTICA